MAWSVRDCGNDHEFGLEIFAQRAIGLGAPGQSVLLAHVEFVVHNQFEELGVGEAIGGGRGDKSGSSSACNISSFAFPKRNACASQPPRSWRYNQAS